MIEGIGIDIEETKRFKNKLNDNNFLSKIFTKEEINYCFSKSLPEQHLTVRFATKEAIFKAISSKKIMTENPLYLKDIEIISNKNEAPSVKINSKVNSQILKEYNIHISLSHTKKYATGIAIIEKITSISK